MSEAFTIHPPIPPCPEQSGWGFARDDWFEDRASERKLTENKRLTDPELGAILWFHVSREAQAEVMGWQTGHAQDWINTNQEECRIVRILERFAALPHYDEAPAHPTRTGTL